MFTNVHPFETPKPLHKENLNTATNSNFIAPNVRMGLHVNDKLLNRT